MKRLLFIFLDGTGIGDASPSNPFFVANSGYLPFYSGDLMLPDRTPIKAIDPVLGIKGLPQSASGQTSLFTGMNIPRLLKAHLGSYPNKIMRKIIRQENILLKLNQKKLKANFINVYPFYSKYFTNKYVRILEDGSFEFSAGFPNPFKRALSVTTCMLITNGITPYNEKDLINGKAIYQDFSNRLIDVRVKKLLKGTAIPNEVKSSSIPKFSAKRAAEILFNAYRKNHFTLYEYFQTDIYAHRRNFQERLSLIANLDLFIGQVLQRMDKNRDTLLITSDHGNLEDGSSLNHTCNPVPLLVWGNESQVIRQKVNSIADITPAIMDFFE